MIEKFRIFAIKQKHLFQVIGPISTILASICFNFRKSDNNRPNNIPILFSEYEISIQFVWIFMIIIAVFSYCIFYFGQRFTSDENNSLKTEKNNLLRLIDENSNKHLQLESEYESLRANYSMFFDKMLSLISVNLNLSGKERISVYFIPKEEEMFILLSKFSKNPSLNQKSNRVYEFKEGFIYQALEEGDIIRNINAISNNESEYLKEVKDLCLISENRLKNLKMKSRSYYIKTINDDSTEIIGLIVLESLDVNKFNEIQEDLSFKTYSEIIKEYISKHRNRFMSNLAKNKGF